MEMKKLLIIGVILVLVATSFFSGCVETGSVGTLRLQITDKPGDLDILYANVTISMIQVHKSGAGDENEDDEDVHGDKIKASNMKELFLEKGVSVLVSKKFGPNIKRIVKNFVPVIVRHDDIEKVKELLIGNAEQVEQMFNEGQKRKPIILSKVTN